MKKELKEELVKMALFVLVALMWATVIMMVVFPGATEYYAVFTISTVLSIIMIIIGLKEGYEWI